MVHPHYGDLSNACLVPTIASNDARFVLPLDTTPFDKDTTMTDATHNLAAGSVAAAREHYRASGLAERLRNALLAFGPEHQRLTPAQLAQLDQFHTRGAAATQDLARLAAIAAADRVLDLGSGIGGPARLLAATCGCPVVGID